MTGPPVDPSPPPPSNRMATLWSKRPKHLRRIVIGLSVGYFAASTYCQYVQQKRRDVIHEKSLLHWRLSNGSVVENAKEMKGFGGALQQKLSGHEDSSPPMSLIDVVKYVTASPSSVASVPLYPHSSPLWKRVLYMHFRI
jgi:hypothetical protein